MYNCCVISRKIISLIPPTIPFASCCKNILERLGDRCHMYISFMAKLSTISNSMYFGQLKLSVLIAISYKETLPC